MSFPCSECGGCGENGWLFPKDCEFCLGTGVDTRNERWLKCDATEGMLSGELAVDVVANGQEFSLFVTNTEIETDGDTVFLRVRAHSEHNGCVLIELPAPMLDAPGEGRFLTVLKSELYLKPAEKRWAIRVIGRDQLGRRCTAYDRYSCRQDAENAELYYWCDGYVTSLVEIPSGSTS